MLDRLIGNWVYGGFLAGVLLLVLGPVLTAGWPASLASAYLLLPVYMLHQYEEHDGDRFRRFANETVGHGVEVLSRGFVFLVNIPGVWGTIAISLILAYAVHPGFTLIAVYLVLVNALAHIGQAIKMRRYNPGLATGVVLFLPAGVFALVETQRGGGGTLAMHIVGLVVAIGIHAGIVAHVRRRLHAHGHAHA